MKYGKDIEFDDIPDKDDCMIDKSKTIFITLIFLGIFGLVERSEATTLYADNTLSTDCAGGNYSIANRDCGGADGKAYNTIQKAINALSIGDIIYLRGGTYRENNGNTDVEIEIPSSKNGDSWEPGHYNTLTSYPGEWAIIDGEGTAPKGVVLGLKGMTYSGESSVLRYWKFERLESQAVLRLGKLKVVQDYGCRRDHLLFGTIIFTTTGMILTRIILRV